MAKRRLKILNREKGTIYHVVSRTVNKEMLWDDTAKEIFRRQIAKVASFCGVEVLSFCIMSNHFHLLIRVITGQSESLSNQDLLLKCQRLYNNPRDAMVLARLEAGLLSIDETEAASTRKLLLARMDDLSNFLKNLKQRFSIWMNRNHQRWGTHWGERFRSTIVESTPRALMAVCAYIALNPVRAGLCRDPKDYRFSSYSEAFMGNRMALQPYQLITGRDSGQEAFNTFRSYVFALGKIPSKDDESAITAAATTGKVRPTEGRLSQMDVWSMRARFFTEGIAIGSKAYLEQLLHDRTIIPTRCTHARDIPGQADLASLRIGRAG